MRSSGCRRPRPARHRSSASAVAVTTEPHRATLARSTRQSAQRQLQAESTVPATASSVKSVKLTVIGSAANLPRTRRRPRRSRSPAPLPHPRPRPRSVGRRARPRPDRDRITDGRPDPPRCRSPPRRRCPSATCPGSPPIGTSPTLSPGGNAGKPVPHAPAVTGFERAKNVKGRPVADSTALPEGASVLGASLIGLAALALAFVLAVTRFSIRRRPAPLPGAAGAAPQQHRPQGPGPTGSTGRGRSSRGIRGARSEDSR